MASCSSCNLNKSDKFPIKNTRNTNIEIIDIEKLNEIEEPQIINPDVDNPEIYFEYSETEGGIIAKNNNERAKATIDICKLNRGNLKDGRKEKYDKITNLVKYLTLYTLTNSKQRDKLKQFAKEVKKGANSQNEYSALQKQIWNNFENSIAPLFKDKQLIDFVLIEYKLTK